MFLSPRKFASLIANHQVKAFICFFDEGVGSSALERFDNFIVRGIGLAKLNVILDRRVQKDRFLSHVADLLAEIGKINIRERLIIN